VLRALDQSKSTYCTTFARLCKEVFTARLEANDNMKYLRTLEEWFRRLNEEVRAPPVLCACTRGVRPPVCVVYMYTRV
jgi:dynein heavy chain